MLCKIFYLKGLAAKYCGSMGYGSFVSKWKSPGFGPGAFFFYGFNYNGLEKTLLQSGSRLFSVG
jgi:hypothetical protein